MDQSQSGPNGHIQQQNNHGSAYSNFLEGPQSYTDDAFGVPEDSGNAPNYDFSWSAELFQEPQPTPTFSHHSPSPAPGFDPNAQQTNSSTTNYGGIQSTLSPNPFSQPQSYDNRSLAQTSYDPRSMSRVLPSPSYPFQPQSYQQNLSYQNRDQALSPSHFQRPLSNASMMLGAHQDQRPSSTGQNFASQTSQSPYQSMDPRQMHQPGFQSVEMSQFPGFNELPQQTANQFISPHMLTASGIRGGASYQQPVQMQQQGQHLVGSASAYMNTVYGDPRMHQTAQSFQQSIAPAYTMQGAQANVAGAGPSTSTFQGVFVPPKVIQPKAPKDPNAPKKPRGRPRKDGSMPKVKKEGEPSSSEESESDDELQVEDLEPEITPAPLTLAPPSPSDLQARAKYNALSAVWSPRNLPAKTEKVKAGGQLYSDTIRMLRDAWKPDNEALTAAENANNVPKVAILKEKVKAYRDTLKQILDHTDQYGHLAHLRHIPLYPLTLTAFHAFLLDRVKRDDYEAPLVHSMMKAFSRFDTMTEEMLEQSKLIKLVQRTAKKGNTDTKALAQKVLDNATAATKASKAKKQNASGPASPKIANGSSDPARPVSHLGLPQKNDAVAGVKRPREGDTSILPATKKSLSKPIIQASKPLAVQQAERRKAEMAKQNVAKSEKPAANGTSAASAPRTKVIVPPQKPATSGVFAGLMSASKKPGTTIAEKAAAAKSKPLVTSTAKKESSPQPSSAPSKPAFSFLDALQGMDKPKEIEKKKEEVRPNETEEERKKRLRKEERGKLRVSWADKLTEVRLFTHDPEEEIGHADSMRRDVGDVGGEGRMLKLHLNDDDLEDDEGEELDSYESPSEVDFSDIDWDERKGHFVKTGGPEMPESNASAAQRLHEDSSVMVVYALPSDQPSSPKEPPETEDDYEPDLASSFGEPPEVVREKEKRWLAAQVPAQNGTFGINAVMRSMQQQQQQPAQSAQIPPELQRTLALLGQQQQPVPQPQAGPRPDLSAIMAVVNQVKAGQQSQIPPPPIFNQPAAVPQQNITAILAALQAQNAQNQQGLPVGSHNNPNPYPGPDNEYSRKHARSDSGADDSDGKKNKKKRGVGVGGGGGEVPYNYKTLVCSFWQKGQCTKGDDCTYRHSD